MSASPDDIDYEVSWSNADCHWFVNQDGTANVSATEQITASARHTGGTVKSTVTSNGGGVPTGSETFPTPMLPRGVLPFGYEVYAPVADFASHSITFTATLTFTGVNDQLDTDNTSSLLIHFPATFVPGSDGVENLVCDHVHG